jgi:branched-chain amino acid transport system ATP-binding protein
MAESWNENPILTVEHLTMRFGGLVAVDDVSFSVGRSDITALIGPNGAGKTTVFNCLTGFYKPTEGRITLRNGDKQFLLERMDDFRISSTAKVARTFQNIRLFSGMTLLENLMISQHNYLMRASGYTLAGIFGLRGYKTAEKAAIEKSKYWLDKVGLTDRADDPAGDLPYGAQRRLEIARAMCTDPVLLCLDEPAAGLNPRESEELNRLLRYIRETHRIGILLIEHDMSVVMGISDHVVVLDYGQKLSDGTATAVRTDPAVIRAYLGVDEEELEVAAKQGDEAIKAIVRDVKAVELEARKPAKSGRAKGNKP